VLLTHTSNLKCDELSQKPKGGCELGESREEAALRETWEEAGVRGDLIDFLGTWEHVSKKRTIFHFYELEVRRVEEEWPELQERERKWVNLQVVSCDKEKVNQICVGDV
jgi:diphosphoinositol-polyphosphate diphosphatase